MLQSCQDRAKKSIVSRCNEGSIFMKKKGKRVRVWPIIRVVQRKSKTVWEVDTGFVIKPRIRKKFDEADLAAAFAEKLKVQRANEGTRAFDLGARERHDAQEAIKVLSGTGVSLTDAAEFYKRHAQVAQSGKTLVQTWEELVDFKQHIQGKSVGYVDGIRCRLKHFVDEFGNRPVAEITAPELQSWLYRDQTISALTRKNYFALLSVLFGFAQGKRDRKRPTAVPYRLDNPMDAVARPTFLSEPPGILTVNEASRLLSHAQATQEKFGLLPYVALALFCGVRAAELRQLQWTDVNLRKGQVTIPARIAKKRRLRNIPITDNCKKWLSPFGKSEGSVAPIDCAHRLVDLVRNAGFRSWPKNAMRHSFGSYYFAMSENAPETSARLGHKGDEMLFEHYRALADKADAEAFFAITP